MAGVPGPTRQDRSRVAADPALLREYQVAYAGPDADAALLRADEPERASADGPSPFAGLEAARRRIFAPGVSEPERRTWHALDAARNAERSLVDAAVLRALATAPSEPEPEPEFRGDAGQGRERRAARTGGRGARPARVLVAVVAAVLIAGVAGARLAVAGAPPAATPSASVDDPAEPPPLSGSTVVTMTDLAAGVQPAEGPVVWTSGEQPLPAPGGSVAVALKCSGAGVVLVQLSSGEQWSFSCSRTERVFRRGSTKAHPQPLFVFATTTGPVEWSLRVATTPVPSASITATCASCSSPPAGEP